MSFAINVVVSACMISLASWLSSRYPTTAGFMVALPLASMLVLPLSYFEHQSTENSFLLAKSIFVAIPVSLLEIGHTSCVLARRLSMGVMSTPGTVRAHPLQKSGHILYTFSLPVILPVCRSI
ncbi:MAG: hypothetical protein V3S56_08025, partial [Gemmatimonadota bacterium]